MPEKTNRKFVPLLILIIVCLIATALLALTNELTAPAREALAQQRILASKQKVFPEAVDFQDHPITDEYSNQIISVEEAFDSVGEPLGYLIYSESAGYGGLVGAYFGLSPAGELVGIDLPPNSETPGLGQKIREEAFYNQALGLTAEDRAAIGSNIDAVSSATISSEAFVKNLNHCLDYFTAELAAPERSN